MKTKKAFPILLSFLAIASIASTAVLGNSPTAYAGGGCGIDPVMVDAGILAAGEVFEVLKTITCADTITEVLLDNSDCEAKGIQVRIVDFGFANSEWLGDEEIVNNNSFPGKTTCTVIFDVTTDQVERFTQTIMVTTPEAEPQVGGELLPIDSTALALAGLQTSAIWILPVLAGVAGSAFGVLYIKYRRN